MNEKTFLMIYLYFTIHHSFQVIATEETTATTTTSSAPKTQTTLHLKYNINESQHPPSLCDDNPGFNDSHRIICSQKGLLLKYTICATYNEEAKILSRIKCPYFRPNAYNITTHSKYSYIQIPKNLSQLNDYMCRPLNRKGLVCSECADGFGPSVTSFGYRCVKCTDAWYGVPLFLTLYFAPITVLYLIILVFQISISSAPMPCFIMYAQIIAIVIDSNYSKAITKTLLKENWDFRPDMQIIITLYGIFNLDFCHYNTFPPYCLSNKLKFIHITAFGYISAFYPILLIFLTWVCIELHGRNFRPLVWLWRPFHRCFV